MSFYICRGNLIRASIYIAVRVRHFILRCSAKIVGPRFTPFAGPLACTALYQFAVNHYNNNNILFIFLYNTVRVCIILLSMCVCVRAVSARPLCPGANAFYFLPHCSRRPRPRHTAIFVRGRRRRRTSRPVGLAPYGSWRGRRPRTCRTYSRAGVRKSLAIMYYRRAIFAWGLIGARDNRGGGCAQYFITIYILACRGHDKTGRHLGNGELKTEPVPDEPHNFVGTSFPLRNRRTLFLLHAHRSDRG